MSGRYILTIKRNGVVKARGVKQGFKEDKTTADGDGFVYYSHVAKMDSIRAALSRPNRGNRCIATKDVSVAFLQSHPYDGFVKYICFRADCHITAIFLTVSLDTTLNSVRSRIPYHTAGACKP